MTSIDRAGDPFALSGYREADGTKQVRLWGSDEGFEFADLLDFINPLQHIPIISNIYREVTGDRIGALARIAGGALLGGPLGVIGALANVAAETETGKDLGELAMSVLDGEAGPDGDGSTVQSAALSDRADAVAWLHDGTPDRPAGIPPEGPAPVLAAESSGGMFARRGFTDDPLWQTAIYAAPAAPVPAPVPDTPFGPGDGRIDRYEALSRHQGARSILLDGLV